MTTASPQIALFIRNFSQYGGVERVCFNFFHYLQNNGFSTTVYCGKNSTNIHDKRINEITFPFRGRLFKEVSFWLAAQKKLSALPKSVRSMAFSPVPGCTAYRSGGPHADFMRRSLKAQPSTSARLQKQFKRFISPINHLLVSFDRKIYTHPGTAHFIALSPFIKSDICRSFPEAGPKTCVIPNGINKNKFHPLNAEERNAARKEFGLPQHARIIGFCSTNFELKGLYHLINSIPHLTEDVILAVAGGRNSQKYEQQAETLNIKERIFFLGKVKDMPLFYNSLDTLCHPSFYDTFGNVVVESLACGVPVVTTEFVGASSFIQDGYNGFITDPLSSKLLAEHLQKSLQIHKAASTDCPSEEEIFEQYAKILTE